MPGFWEQLLSSDFMPHGHCYYWDPSVVWLHVISDVLTSAAYYSIPVALFVFVRRRRDLAFPSIFWLFAAFILACGTTHVLNIVTLWHPVYRLEGVIKAVTGGVSVVTAIVLWPLIPRALQLPSPAQLESVNDQLRDENLQRRHAEAKLKLANEALEARVAARTDELRRSNQDLERFAYIASHDLQEPMRVMASYAQLLERRYGSKLDADGKEFIDTIIDAGDRGRALIQDLLEFSRIGREGREPEPVELGEAVSLAVGRFEARLEEAGATVQTRGLEGLTVSAVPSRLGQVLDNLLANAIKYRSERPAQVVVEGRRVDGEVEVSVSDNGIGIAAEDAERVFEMFHRVRPHGDVEGSGVGLALCRRIVEHLGGRIWVDTDVGDGTTIRLRIPEASA